MTADNLHTGLCFVELNLFKLATINACFYLNVPYNISLAERHWLRDDLRPSNILLPSICQI